MANKAGNIIRIIVGWGIYIALITGGLTFFVFIAALIIGGGKDGTGQAIAVFLQKQLFPIIIRVASFSVILGIVCMYINKEHALSLKADKTGAEKEPDVSKSTQI